MTFPEVSPDCVVWGPDLVTYRLYKITINGHIGYLSDTEYRNRIINIVGAIEYNNRLLTIENNNIRPTEYHRCEFTGHGHEYISPIENIKDHTTMILDFFTDVVLSEDHTINRDNFRYTAEPLYDLNNNA
jgi:hypothetical protein